MDREEIVDAVAELRLQPIEQLEMHEMQQVVVGAAVDEGGRGDANALADGPLQRRTLSGEGIGLRARFEQQADHADVVVVRGDVQRPAAGRPGVAAEAFDVRPVVDQQPSDGEVVSRAPGPMSLMMLGLTASVPLMSGCTVRSGRCPAAARSCCRRTRHRSGKRRRAAAG